MSEDSVAPLAGAGAGKTTIPPLDLTTLASTLASNLTKDSCFVGSDEAGVDVVGLVAIIIFYLAVLGVSDHIRR